MKAVKLYEKLDKDFITPKMSDEWIEYMDSITDYLSDRFKDIEMGLVCDNSDDIEFVYSAVFPSERVMHHILDQGKRNCLLFVHHPSIWDIRKAPNIFYQMDRGLLDQFKQRNISIYNLHVPLDAFGEYSTSVNLAKALNIEIEKAFAPYHGVLAGVIGKVAVGTVQELKNVYEEAVGHEIMAYQYGDDKIKNGRVAVVAGGGNDTDLVKDLIKENVNTFVTGVTIKNDFSAETHNFEKENQINVLGGTHYSSEKFACIAMCDYFKKLSLEAEFVPDDPIFEDM